MNRDCSFYICPTCFATSETSNECHNHRMIHCRSLQPGDIRLKPLLDKDGELKTRAPRWFLESLGLDIQE
jgi:hypothetical protein